MRRNESWLSPSSGLHSSRGSRYRDSGRSAAKAGRTLLILVVLLAVLSLVQLVRPVPAPSAQATLSDVAIPGTPPALPWPGHGGGMVEIQNVGVVGSFNAQRQIPLASVAKIITALVLVRDHPLALGSAGPTLVMTPSDASTYLTMKAQQDSVMAVVSGERLSEYQLLEALLIPSADNIAQTLAIWDAGSVQAFVGKMNAYAKSLGMTQTVFKDPSGLSNGTVGSAQDQLVAAKELLKNPVLSQIVAKPQAVLPVAGLVFNVNYNVGHDGFVGIKTGSTTTGANLVFAATGNGSKSDLIVGALLGQQGVQSLGSVLASSRKLVDAARNVPHPVSVLTKGQVVGDIVPPGSAPVPVVSDQSVSLVGWAGLKVVYSARFIKLKGSLASGSKVGTMVVQLGSQQKVVNLVTTRSIEPPSVLWRLKRL